MRAMIPIAGSVVLSEVAEPTPADHEVVVAVEAYSVNRGETFLLESPPTGWRPGKDIAGAVVQGAASGVGPARDQRVVGHPDAAAGPNASPYRPIGSPCCPTTFPPGSPRRFPWRVSPRCDSPASLHHSPASGCC